MIPKTNEEYISVTYGGIKIIESFRFLSCSLNTLVEAFFDNSHKSLKNLKKEFVGEDNKFNIVNEIEKLLGKDENNRSIKNLKKDYPDKNVELKESFFDYMGKNYLKILKTEFPYNWKNLTKKTAYPYEYFNGINDFQKSFDSLQKEDFFSKLKKIPCDNETERTKEINKKSILKMEKN